MSRAMIGNPATLISVVGAAVLAGLNLAQQRRLHAARHDPLTGLPTRQLWTTRARRALRRPRRVVVVMCDGDHVKDANDRFGHDAGDALIVALARRLSAWGGPGAVVGRVGGDEFVACVRIDAAEIADRLETLSAALAAPVRHRGRWLAAGACTGAVLAGGAPAPTLSQLLRAADEALYEAKGERCGGWRMAQPVPAVGVRSAPSGPRPSGPAARISAALSVAAVAADIMADAWPWQKRQT